MVVDGPCDFSVSPSPLGTNLGFELGWTGLDWVGVGPRGLGTKGLEAGLDKIQRRNRQPASSSNPEYLSVLKHSPEFLLSNLSGFLTSSAAWFA